MPGCAQAVKAAAASLSWQDLPCKGRTKEKQGDILAPGDLMIELSASSLSERARRHQVGACFLSSVPVCWPEE